jgi:SAM-dependent methyltransferase
LTGSAVIKADPRRELCELREYLGDRYDHRRLERHGDTVLDEFHEVGDEASFYRKSRGYLYDLTAFAASKTKLPYLERLTATVPPPARVLDYGCGIGSDGLMLLEAGYRVEFADFDNPSVAYLRWRLERRGFTAPVHDLDREVPGGFDAAFAFDVIEHVDDPERFLGELESRSRLVAVNLLEEEEDDLPIHRQLPIARLLDRAASAMIVHYGIYHGRSHLLLYRPDRSGARARIRSRGELLRGRTHARLASARTRLRAGSSA